MPCNKVAFASKQDARRAAENYKGRAQGQVLRPYKCKHCGEFHFTSKTKRQEKEDRKASQRMKSVPRPEAIELRRKQQEERAERLERYHLNHIGL